MRLIDADAFMDSFYVASAGQDKAFINAVEMVMEDTPTIDAEPVRHGRWECYLSDPFCTECGQFAETCTNYCPNCGAKMDLEVQDDD